MFKLLTFVAASFGILLGYETGGYILYCPCMGRFGNQADHFLGAFAFSKAINRTLVLPPWVEYRYGELKSIQVPFDTYFDIKVLKQFHNVVTMESFMETLAQDRWPPHKRVSFCYTKRIGEIENSCNAKSGNPFGPFWDTFGIEFVESEFYGPLNYDAQNTNMMELWNKNYPARKWPVLAFTGAPASFPVQKENVYLQRYLVWNNGILNEAKSFIKKHMSSASFLGIHLRNGQDWAKACQHVPESPKLFSAPQCVGYKSERGKLTHSMCLPTKTEIFNQIKRTLKKFKDIKYLFVASDSNHMTEELNNALQYMDMSIVKLQPSNPHVDLAILGQANFFIGNCVSSFTAFVKRERDVKGLPSEFWSFTSRKKTKHDEF